MKYKWIILCALFVGLIGSSSGALANKLLYRPLNPSFGGNPNNTAFLFNNAAVQNQFAGSGGSGNGGAPSFDFGDGFGNGPVIIINPGDTDVDAPDVDINSEETP